MQTKPTTHRTRVSFLDGREPVYLIGWKKITSKLFKQYGPKAVFEYGYETSDGGFRYK